MAAVANVTEVSVCFLHMYSAGFGMCALGCTTSLHSKPAVQPR